LLVFGVEPTTFCLAKIVVGSVQGMKRKSVYIFCE